MNDPKVIREQAIEEVALLIAKVLPRARRGELKAMNTLIRLWNHQAKLLGLYAAKKLDIVRESEPANKGCAVCAERERLGRIQ